MPEDHGVTMAWKRVLSYMLGYGVKEKQFYLYYTLEGETAAHQIFPTPQAFIALADMFRHEGPINYNDAGDYFVTGSELVEKLEKNQ
jgi:hypothetical protein